ncbi:Type II secretion system protein M [Gammaproteobacteria bacterium]
MNTWWEELSSQERIMVTLGAGVILAATLFLVVWEPFYAHLRTLRQTVTEERIQVAWMVQAALEVGPLRGIAMVAEKQTGGSLLALVDRSARAAGMGAGLNRVEPEGKDKVRVWLNDIAFDPLIPWLTELGKTQGVAPESLVIDRQATPGRVNARLVLVGGGT